jgi:hypothetical protein
MGRHGLDSSSSWKRHVAGCHDHGNKSLSSIILGNFLTSCSTISFSRRTLCFYLLVRKSVSQVVTNTYKLKF